VGVAWEARARCEEKRDEVWEVTSDPRWQLNEPGLTGSLQIFTNHSEVKNPTLDEIIESTSSQGHPWHAATLALAMKRKAFLSKAGLVLVVLASLWLAGCTATVTT
jgi:hypothetical protein